MEQNESRKSLQQALTQKQVQRSPVKKLMQMKGEEVKMERFSSFYGNDTANETSSNLQQVSSAVKLESHTFEQLQQRTMS